MARTVWWFRCRFTGNAISADGATSPPNWRGGSAASPRAAALPPILVRHRTTGDQGGLSRRQRHRNIAGAFSVRHDGRTRLAGRPVVLVDDVMTTGATLFTAVKCPSAAGGGPRGATARALILRLKDRI